MTIRRRLYISNILMIVLPVLIAAIVVGCFSHILPGTLSMSRNGPRGWDINTIQDATLIAGTWTEASTSEEIEASLADVIEDVPQTDTVALGVYRDGQPMYTLGDTTLLPAISPSAELDKFFVTITTNVGPYTLIGVQENQTAKWIFDNDIRSHTTVIALLLLTGMIAVIICVNLFLTRFNFRHVMQPLSALTEGVRHIAEGNLFYRIPYEGKDEFTPIINDFNDMAARLQAMVAAQQKDDESRRELIAGISHDLRTPLTSIVGYVEGLEKGVAKTPAAQARYLSVIYDQAQILDHIINQLFLFTKLDTDSFPMHMERTDVTQALKDYVDTIWEPFADKRLSIDLALPEEPLYVRADQVQLRNVWNNILENSAKYAGMDSHVEIRCFQENEEVIITMADDGPGVDSQFL